VSAPGAGKIKHQCRSGTGSSGGIRVTAKLMKRSEFQTHGDTWESNSREVESFLISSPRDKPATPSGQLSPLPQQLSSRLQKHDLSF
jgi:hypothetical protein